MPANSQDTQATHITLLTSQSLSGSQNNLLQPKGLGPIAEADEGADGGVGHETEGANSRASCGTLAGAFAKASTLLELQSRPGTMGKKTSHGRTPSRSGSTSHSPGLNVPIGCQTHSQSVLSSDRSGLRQGQKWKATNNNKGTCSSRRIRK